MRVGAAVADDYAYELLRRIAEWDWVISFQGEQLHHAEAAAVDVDGWQFEDVKTSCGRTFDIAVIPGMFTHMGAKRCDRCCDRVGYPRGEGSPKNDPACAELLKKRIRAVSR